VEIKHCWVVIPAQAGDSVDFDPERTEMTGFPPARE